MSEFREKARKRRTTEDGWKAAVHLHRRPVLDTGFGFSSSRHATK